MNTQSLILFGVTLSIFLQVLSVGMSVAPADLSYLLSKPSRLLRSLFAMSVLLPLVVVAVCKVFSLHQAVIVALVTLSTAPVGAMFSNAMLPLVAPDKPAYARGLFFASTLLSVILTPLAVEVIQMLFGEREAVHVRPLAVAKVVVSSVLLPLGIGLAIGRLRPATKRWAPALQKIGGILLLVCVVLIIVGAWSLIASVVREGTLLAIVMIALIGLAIGHVLGGPDADDRTVLAFATISRHPGVAIAVAGFTDQPLAPLGVLLAVVVSELAAAPYKAWRKRLRSTAAGAAQESRARGAH